MVRVLGLGMQQGLLVALVSVTLLRGDETGGKLRTCGAGVGITAHLGTVFDSAGHKYRDIPAVFLRKGSSAVSTSCKSSSRGRGCPA